MATPYRCYEFCRDPVGRIMFVVAIIMISFMAIFIVGHYYALSSQNELGKNELGFMIDVDKDNVSSMMTKGNANV